jgi:hypothetical protein
LKIENALGWLLTELERRLRVKEEVATEFDSKILCVINSVSGNIGYEENIFRSIEKLVNMGHLVGIHIIVVRHWQVKVCLFFALPQDYF